MIVDGLFTRNAGDIKVEMIRHGISETEIEPMSARGVFHVLRISGVSGRVSGELKKQMTQAGGSAAAPLLPDSRADVDILLMGTSDVYQICFAPGGKADISMPEISRAIMKVVRNMNSAAPEPIMWPDGPMQFGNKTYIMGIINCTPDSFYDGGNNFDLSEAIETAKGMILNGVDIIDIGGESTRPGSETVMVDEELRRTVPLIKTLKKEFPEIRISIDTMKSAVASAALNAGAGLINDVSGLLFDKDMAKVSADTNVPVCIMHMQGTPGTMQQNPKYPGDVCYEINRFFRERIEFAISSGIKESQIILDPGIGFGKTVEHNLEILSRLSEFRSHGLPLLIGASRKSFIGKTLSVDPEDRLEGSLAAAVISVYGGADILRVHDVKQTVRAIALTDAVVRKRRMLETKFY